MTNDTIFIEGKQIYLRPFCNEDVNSKYLSWINDPVLTQGLDTGTFPTTLSELQEYVESHKGSRNSILLAVCLKENNQYIGNCRISDIDWLNRSAKYGRLIGESNLHGRGIGTELLTLILNYIFNTLNLNRAYTGVLSNNKASIKSNFKAGMNEDGILRKARFKNGEYVNVHIFSLLKEEFIRDK